MFARLLSTAALAGGFLVSAPAADSTPVAETLRYRVSVAALQVADLSSMGAGEQRVSTGITGFITITLTPGSGGQALVIVLDSMVVDSATQGLAMLQTAADSARGSRWTGVLTKEGKIEDLTLVQGGTGAHQFETVLTGFFPRGAAHTRKKGEVWGDTLAYSSSSEDGSTSITVMTTFTAAGESTFGGSKALQVGTTSVTKSSGSQEGPNGGMTFEGGGTGAGVLYVTKEGRYLGGTNTLDSEITVTPDAAPVAIPVKAHTVITINSL